MACVPVYSAPAVSWSQRLTRALASTLGEPAWGLLLMRVVIGMIFFAHGAQKLEGWFGGAGPDASAAVYANAWGIGSLGFYVSSMTEMFGGAALIVGLLTRVAALGLVIDMCVAIVVVHLSHGLLGPQGMEYPLVLMTTMLAILMMGAGRFSLDRVVFDWRP